MINDFFWGSDHGKLAHDFLHCVGCRHLDGDICSVASLIISKFVTLIAFLVTASAVAGDELKNWFGDPFFQIAGDVPACPVPLGPLLTEAEMKGEAHSRAERGTSCWMAGQCRQPNAYLYDAAIAQAIRGRMMSEELRGSSVWITVKRRFVWAEGCVAGAAQAAHIEAVLREVPDVERVFINLMPATAGRPPYPALPEKLNK